MEGASSRDEGWLYSTCINTDDVCGTGYRELVIGVSRRTYYLMVLPLLLAPGFNMNLNGMVKLTLEGHDVGWIGKNNLLSELGENKAGFPP